MLEWVRRQFVWIISFLLPSGSLGSSLGGQAWWQAPLLTEPSYWLDIIVLHLADFKDFVFLKAGVCKRNTILERKMVGEMTLVFESWGYMENNLRLLNLWKVGFLKYFPDTQPPPCLSTLSSRPYQHGWDFPESALTLLTAFWNSSVSQGWRPSPGTQPCQVPALTHSLLQNLSHGLSLDCGIREALLCATGQGRC